MISKALQKQKNIIFATGRGFDDLLLFTKGNGKGFWQWEGVLAIGRGFMICGFIVNKPGSPALPGGQGSLGGGPQQFIF